MAPRPMRDWWRMAAVLGCLVLLAGSPAHAHTGLVSSVPRDGAALAEAPPAVTLRFDGEVRAPAYVVVTAPDGARAEQGAAEVDGAAVTQRLAALGSRGRYTVAYRVVPVDGHPVTGELAFTLTAGTPAAGPASAQPAASGGADHDHPSGPAAHWQHILPVVGVLAAWLGVEWKSRRRRRA